MKSTYDANGNTLSDAQGRSFTWNFENRPTQVVNPGVGTTTFKYDPFGRRIQKSGSLGTTKYLYDGRNSDSNVIEEADNGGNVLARYAQGNRVDEPISALRGSTTSYYTADGLGSITALTAPTGALVNTYTYDSFGSTTSSTGTTVNPYQFTGRDYDPETGGRYYRARYYDSNIGRFVSEDPIGHRGGINFYTYVLNRPTVLRDPSGLLHGCPNPCSICRQWCDAQGALCHAAFNIFYWECKILCQITPGKPAGTCMICRVLEDKGKECDATTDHCKLFDCANACQSTPPWPLL